MRARAIKSNELSDLALNDFDSAQPGSAEDWESDLAVAGHLEKYILPMFYKLFEGFWETVSTSGNRLWRKGSQWEFCGCGLANLDFTKGFEGFPMISSISHRKQRQCPAHGDAPVTVGKHGKVDLSKVL